MHALFSNLTLTGRLDARTSRKDFVSTFIFYLLLSIIIILTYILLVKCNVNNNVLIYLSKFKVFFTSFFGIAILSMFIRRLHDTNRTGWHILWILFPIIGWTILLIFLFDRPYNENNKYPIENIKPNYSFLFFSFVLCILIAINSNYEIQTSIDYLNNSYTELTTTSKDYINTDSINELSKDSTDYNFVGTWIFEKETQQGIFVQQLEIKPNKTFTYNCGYKDDFINNNNIFYITGDISIKHNKMILTLNEYSDATSYTFTKGDCFNCYLLDNETLLVDMFDNGYITTYSKCITDIFTTSEEPEENTNNENSNTMSNENVEQEQNETNNTQIQNNDNKQNINNNIYDTIHQFETENTINDFYYKNPESNYTL